MNLTSNSLSAVPKDTILPVISHESRKSATANMPLTLFAEVSDNVFTFGQLTYSIAYW